MERIVVGSLRIELCKFESHDTGLPVTPGTVTLRCLKPDGTTTNITGTRDTLTGFYPVNVLYDQPGKWKLMLIGTSPVIETALADRYVQPGI